LATLPAFQSWGGVAADAAKNADRAAERHLSTCGQAYATMETHHTQLVDSQVRP
jgi:hypothetical protein